MSKKRIIRLIISILLPLILFSSWLATYHWMHYSNKNNLLEKYIVDNSKEVYILGTIGKKHFNKITHYSMEDMLSAIENIHPDVVMIKAKKDSKDNYSVIDGDISACVSYSYCINKNIPVQLVDWWIVDNIYQESKNYELRADNIFIKISRNLKELPQNSKILVIMDSDEFQNQTARFRISGFKEQEMSKEEIKNYFTANSQNFAFPPLCSKIWKDRSYFYAYILPRIIRENTELSDSVKDLFINADHDKYYIEQIKYCSYLNNNIMYK